ncbi:MAG: PaaI family thioesterase [Pseudomonadota bacterium]
MKAPTNKEAAALKIAQAFVRIVPLASDLQMALEDVAEASVRMSLPYNERLVGDPETGVVHGGVITALLDTCCGAAVLIHPETGISTATIDLRIDYMRPAPPNKKLMATAKCYRMTRYVAFVRATAYTVSEDEPVATAHGAFTVERRTGIT